MIDHESVVVGWVNPQRTILRFQLPYVWSWREFGKAIAQAQQLLTEVSHPVAYIFQAAETTMLPQDFIQHAGRFLENRRPQVKLIVLVVRKDFNRYICDVLVRLYHAEGFLHIVDTFDEAHDLILARLR